MVFRDYFRKNYHLGDTSVKDYISRWNGILNKGLYNGETELTPSLIASVDRAYLEDSHYRLTLKRYIEFHVSRYISFWQVNWDGFRFYFRKRNS